MPSRVHVLSVTQILRPRLAQSVLPGLGEGMGWRIHSALTKDRAPIPSPLIWNDVSTVVSRDLPFLASIGGGKMGLLRRCISLIYAGRNRIVLVRRELP